MNKRGLCERDSRAPGLNDSQSDSESKEEEGRHKQLSDDSSNNKSPEKEQVSKVSHVTLSIRI